MLVSPFFTPEEQSNVYRTALGCPSFIIVFIIAYLIAKELKKKR